MTLSFFEKKSNLMLTFPGGMVYIKQAVANGNNKTSENMFSRAFFERAENKKDKKVVDKQNST